MHDDELAGLPAALTAYTHRPTWTRRRIMLSRAAALLAAKTVATAGGVAIGTIALAGATGSLPTTIQQAAHDTVGAPAPHVKSEPAESPEPTDSPEPTESPEPKGTPTPNLVGLCRAFDEGNKATHGKALQSPAFTVLITTAGGQDKVQGFCTALLATAPGGQPTSVPGFSHRPSPFPGHAHGNAPTAHPTGRP